MSVIAGFTNYFMTLVFRTYFTNGTLWAALYTTTPLGGPSPQNGVEAAYPGYTRQPITFGQPFIDRVGNVQVAHNNTVQFPTPSANGPNVNAVVVMDASSGGHIYSNSQVRLAGVPTSVPIVSGTAILPFSPGSIQVVHNALAALSSPADSLNGFFNYLALKVLTDQFVNGSTFLGLLTAAASPSTSGTEVTDAGYARQAITWLAAQMNPYSGAVTGNNGTITIPNAVTGYTAIGTGVYDAVSGGHLLAYNNILNLNGVATPKVVGVGQGVAFTTMSGGGTAALLRTISGGSTTLNGAEGISIDTVNNEIWVANTTAGDLIAFSRTANGNVAPLRSIVDSLGTIMVDPTGVAVDPVNNEVYAACSPVAGTSIISVWSRTANGSVSPIRTLSGGATGLNFPSAIAVDTVNNEVYVGNTNGTAKIMVFSRTASGNTAPLRTISGAATGLGIVYGIAIDTVNNEIAVVSRNSNAVQVFARTASGNVAPLRSITGAATNLSQPYGVYIDTVNNEIGVANGFSNIATVYSRTANGNVAPTWSIGTSMSTPTGIYVDTTNNEIGVPNAGNSTVTVYSRAGGGSGFLTNDQAHIEVAMSV